VPFFLADRFETRKRVLERIREFLQGHNYPTYLVPNDANPRKLVALVRTEDYADSYPLGYATVEVRWRVRGIGGEQLGSAPETMDHFELRWMDAVDVAFDVEQIGTEVEELPDGFTPTFGLHQDESHPELGPNHFQTEWPGEANAQREVAPPALVGESPIAIVDYFLSVAPERLRAFRTEFTERS
jgi:hypothetical protein